MAPTLSEEIRQTQPFGSAEEETYLNLQRTASLLGQALSRSLRSFQLTPTQYNVLRVLRGAHPQTLTCGEVGERLVTSVPDVTRLIDRLVPRELVERSRDPNDRRVVRVGIAAAGLDLLARLDQPVDDWMKEQLGHLGEPDLRQLIALLEKARESVSGSRLVKERS